MPVNIILTGIVVANPAYKYHRRYIRRATWVIMAFIVQLGVLYAGVSRVMDATTSAGFFLAALTGLGGVWWIKTDTFSRLEAIRLQILAEIRAGK